MKDGKPNLRAAVRAWAKSAGVFRRQDVYNAFPELDPRTKVDPAFFSLCRAGAGDRCVQAVKRVHEKCTDGSRRSVSLFMYVDPTDPTAWPKALSEVANRGGATNRIRAKVQHAPSGYAPGWFTAPFRAPTEDGEYGFPPRFDWDGKRGYIKPAPISQVQAMLRLAGVAA